MAENLSNEQAIVSKKNPIQEKISLLCENDFVWKQIAALTDLPKKLIKGIAKGRFIPNEEEYIRLEKRFDDAISKLRISRETHNNNASLDAELNVEECEHHTIGIKSMSFYKSRDDDRMFFQIHGVKLYD